MSRVNKGAGPRHTAWALGRTAALAALMVCGVALAGSGAGALDTTFGGGDGIVVTPMSPGGQIANLAIQSDDKIIAVGFDRMNAHLTTGENEMWAIYRYGVDGTLDSSFGSAGTGKIELFGEVGSHYAYDVTIDASGRILIVGVAYEEQRSGKGKGKTTIVGGGAVVRLLADGSLDSSFGTGGKVFTAMTNASSVTIQPDGKIVVGGWTRHTVQTGSGKGKKGNKTSDAFALARLNADGSVDTSFGTDGLVVDDIAPPGTAVDAGSDAIVEIALQTDGRIVAIGRSRPEGSNREAIIARYLTDGSVDTSFGAGGKVNTLLGLGEDVRDLAIQTDGKIVVAGPGRDAANEALVWVARYDSSGNLDTSFDADGLYTFDDLAIATFDVTLAIQPDGRLVVGFDHENAAGTSDDVSLLRLETDGSLDTTFGTGGVSEAADAGEWDNVFAMAIDGQGRIVIGGWTSAYPGGTGPEEPDWLLARFCD